ncbi:MAG: branched-chain amino acid ABC transporter permease [Clostridiaceae bacterium]|jgi:branched-chain amino acid transport system permease protein|nr:branched-chain amino acid ABC transporter permease [Bacillota bacterium]NLN52030.1 branched-chain amino acid ABC transporter permease [Clostridiaceae bacterium]
MSRNKRLIYLINIGLVLILFAILTILEASGVFTRYTMSILRLVCINVVLATSLNVTVGNLGQITLGHAGFMSIGAYTAGLFAKGVEIGGQNGYLIGILLAGICAGIFGIIVGIPVLRLKGDYLAIVTLAFGEIIRVLIEYFDFTGGAQGLNGIPRMQNFSVMFFLAVICVTLMYSVMTSRHGRAVLAIREDEIAAQSSGINITYYKTFAFTLSAFFAGIAGAMYAHNIGTIGASVFNYNKSFDILVMVVLGGMGSFTGAVISATVLTIVPETLRQFNDYRMIIYSLLLIMVMLFRPEGLLGRKEFHITKVVDKIKTKFGKHSVEGGS